MDSIQELGARVSALHFECALQGPLIRYNTEMFVNDSILSTQRSIQRQR